MKKKLLGILIVLSIIGSMLTIILPQITFASSMTGLSGYKTIGGNGQVSIGGGVPIVIGQNQVGGSAPSVTTGAASAIGTNSVTMAESVTNTNGANVTTWGTYYGLTTSYGNTTVNTGSHSSSFGWNDSVSALSSATLYDYEGYATSSNGTGTGSNATFLTLPYAPFSLVATPESGQVNFSWSAASGGSGTIIYTQVQYSTSGYPSSYSSGTTGIAWTTSTAGTITGLTNGTLYYFSAFSEAINSALIQYSSTGYGVQATPNSISAPTITISAATYVANNSAQLNGNITATGGANPTVTVYWGTSDGGQVAGNWQNSSTNISPSQPQGITSFYLPVTGLIANTKYYFSASAVNSAGTSWPVASLNFTTTSSSIGNVTNLFCTPGASGASTDTEMTITWQVASNALDTIVQYKTGGYPTSPTDGTTAYNGAGIICIQTGLVAGTTYYYSAWGYNGATYSASVDNFMMTTSATNSSGVVSTTIPVPSQNMNPPAPSSSSWFTNMQPFSGFVRSFENSWGMSTDLMQYSFGILILLAAGFFLYIKTKSPLMPFIGGIIIDFGLILLNLMPAYSVAIIIAFGLGVWSLENIWI